MLFVGGTFYKHSVLAQKRVSEKFRRDFQDNTREKAPSLQVSISIIRAFWMKFPFDIIQKGCIAEIVVGGQRENLEQLVEAQIEKAKRNGGDEKGDEEEIFGIEKGCAECPAKCIG